MGKYHPGLTEKRMRDKRFKRTEEAILRVFFEEDNYISIEEIAKKVGVARSTFYHHHRAIREIIPDYERFLLRRYRRRVRRLLKKDNVRMKILYFEMLTFMARHREALGTLERDNRREVIAKMIQELAPKMDRLGSANDAHGKIMRVYQSEVVEIVRMWGEEGFSNEKIEVVLKDIMYLTETARVRLKPLGGGKLR
ncbi:TetR family transcriptional regulator [Candidatus Saccharibacteria bacterium]|nr:TetR family transcriptional regulator [Candidatus Saccharibacteria bacterium]